ncbi:S24 family peptidase [Sinorhizobium meliloti]|uniref:S24 family peptidase n=1 Tax=Rhizobium meliloti TaxID=382 RepID=UPI000FDA43A4|nr:S24 family peptidase [Sinorhizobium meliloti]MDW9408173.1 helix-turn-helix transcriptional regulator [Sinorhizobium meliloti]MDW9453464.1 helix-turn-helix transcriptional regulator [Sinorhizobium meliloti]MDW9466103.1 helix-turn-helix transcriptional regulator [Sinorhizobium meliloti]MDW9500413.1 helix-turn-helix transcriptional regulator [Sinorhizobium meliloti]MDW9554118.1 helix-turn-helix transcriptional regulator [Sinorhizobium meliloti]
MSDPQYQLKQWLAEKLAARGVASKLAEATGMSNDKITRSKELHSDDPKKRRQISLQEIEAMARFFRELPPGFEQMTRWLEDLPPAPTAKPIPNASFPPRWQQFPGDVSIPLRGHIAAGANGRFIMNGQDIATVFCPPGLEGVEGAYAVQVDGRSGEPRFFHGETAWVNPHQKVRQGDDVVVQILEDDEISSYLKRFVSRSADVLRLYQYNPGKGESHDLEFPTDKVFSVHKVVFHAML